MLHTDKVQALYKQNRAKSYGRITVLALVAKGKKILDHRTNRYGYFNRVAKRLNAWSTHAEMAVLDDDGDYARKTLYVYRETSDGKPALARPCVLCMNLLIQKGIKNVIYSIPVTPFFKEQRL